MIGLPSVAIRGVASAVAGFEPRGRSLAVARSLLAAAQLTVLLANPDVALFVDTPEAPDGVRCDGVRAVSLWCLTSGSGGDDRTAGRVIAIVVLGLVLSGYRPRWTCVPHWYVAFGMAASMPMSNGGDRIAQLACMLLIPMCLGDDRRWQWRAPHTPLAEHWRGHALAAQLAIRGQILVIYVYAAVSKLTDPIWRDGAALRVVALDPHFGSRLAERLLGSGWFVVVVNWGAIAVQFAIAVAVFGGLRARRFALAAGISLHGLIALLLNLPVFGLVMAGLLVAGCGPLGSDAPLVTTTDGVRAGRFGATVGAGPGR